MEELGFECIKTTNDKIIYKKIETYDKKFLGIEKDTQVLIFNKNSKRVFMKRIIKQGGKEHYEPFCADLKLLNVIADFIKNM